ncbi:MAG: Rab family GTPase [Candidatus Hodarchaeota archaeon]
MHKRSELSSSVLFWKVVMLGEAMVGKTTLVKAFMGVEFTEGYKATLGTDLSRKVVQINDEEVIFQIWDLAGQQAFKTIRSTFLKGAKGAIVVYDISSRESFLKTKDWLKELFSVVGKIPVVLVGNKLDLRESAPVTKRRQKLVKTEQYLVRTFSAIQVLKEGTARDVAKKTGRKVSTEAIYLHALFKKGKVIREKKENLIIYRTKEDIKQDITPIKRTHIEYITTEEGKKLAKIFSEVTEFETVFVEASALYRQNSDTPFINLGKIIMRSLK